MAKYDAIAASGAALIARKGAQIVLTRVVDTGFDPVTQTRATNTVSGQFAVVEVPPGKSAEMRIGSLVGRNVRQFYMARAGQTMEPAVGDTLEWQGGTYALIPPLTHYDPAGDGAILTVAYAER